ncbi:PREDICTED: uncharacterized protein LOC109179964 [Ipomoea nil]|uniref:uncharacterized protein LOC109179964 n=1 Tax=Ipomoea nil TaxID=35883 RepID=UPI000901AB54|nr:PREDICTED: uncharacterized protein LOC109179964 [Ipomoea nil]
MERDHPNRSRPLAFNLSKFDDWKVRMQAHLLAIHDEMWDVIEDGPIVVMMVNTQAAAEGEDPEVMIPKPKSQLTSDEKTRANLDNVARDILYKSLDDSLFPRVRKCKTAKETWNILMNLGEGDEQEKDNKLTVAMKKFEDFKMLPAETIPDMEFRFTKLMGEISDLGKEPTEKEKNLKILRGLPKSWEMKVAVMRDHQDMKTISSMKIFSDLKAHEFEHEPKESDEAETRNIALVANQQPSTSNRSKSNPSDFLSDEQFALFVRRMKWSIRKNNFQEQQKFQSPSNRRQYEKSPQASTQETIDGQMLCYNCQKPGHFKANYPRPMVRKYQDQEPSTGASKDVAEVSKRGDKREQNQPRHERRRRAMVVNESAKTIETENSSLSSSSDDESTEEEKGLLCLFSEEEETNDLCLMAQDDEVNSQSSSSIQMESSSVSGQSSNESVSEMMRDFIIIKSTYSKLKEENSQLIIIHDELRRVRIENIKLAIVKDQLKKQVLSLKEQCTERELREQQLRKVLDSFNNSSNLMDRMVNGSKPLGEITEIGYDLSSPSHVLLNKPTNVYSRESFKFAFVQGPTQISV